MSIIQQKNNKDKEETSNKCTEININNIPIICSRCVGKGIYCILCKGNSSKKNKDASSFIQIICGRCHGRSFDCNYCGGLPYAS
jgi:hypothetical protein